MNMSEKPPPPNWIIQHRTVSYQQMKSLEVEDSAQVHVAFLVYMDLTEVRQWKEVSCVKSPELQVILLEGREKEGAPVQTILPLPAHQSLSHKSFLLSAVQHTSGAGQRLSHVVVCSSF
ncbi:tRNA-splicing endonuclease subunit Sen15 isoform X3 [Sander vitreus]